MYGHSTEIRLTHGGSPSSKSINVPNVGSVVSGVSAATVNDHREQLVHTATPHRAILTVGGHVQLKWELEFASVLEVIVWNT